MGGTEPSKSGGHDRVTVPAKARADEPPDPSDDDMPTQFLSPPGGPADGGLGRASEQTVLRPAPRSGRAGNLEGTLFAGRYRLGRRLGEGGMAVVYEADHAALDRRVAVKILADEFTANPDRVERFLREARTASRIRHPNVVEVTDCGIAENGKVYFVMDCLDGADLGTLLEKKGRVTWQHAVAITLQICEALDAAHAIGIIHRDIKPDNCFLSRQPGGGSCIKVLDFGIAKLVEEDPSARKLTQTGQIFGTPHYMAPEQARSSVVDHRVDLYAAAAIQYELLTGGYANISRATPMAHRWSSISRRSLNSGLKTSNPIRRAAVPGSVAVSPRTAASRSKTPTCATVERRRVGPSMATRATSVQTSTPPSSWHAASPRPIAPRRRRCLGSRRTSAATATAGRSASCTSIAATSRTRTCCGCTTERFR